MATGNGDMSGGRTSTRGTPQGGVASPLLANIYMNRFLKHWRLADAAKHSARTSSTMPMTSSSSAAARRKRLWRGQER